MYNGYTFKPRALTTCLVFTDASGDRYGGFILKRLKEEVCSAKFTDCEKQISSTHRESLPLYMSWIASGKCHESNLFKSI